MCTANPPEWAIQQQISGDQQGASNINLEQPGALISSSSKSLTSDCSISVEAAEAELIRLEAPDTEAVGLRDALQRLVLEGRVGAGESQTLADQVSAQVGSFGKVSASSSRPRRYCRRRRYPFLGQVTKPRILKLRAVAARLPQKAGRSRVSQNCPGSGI